MKYFLRDQKNRLSEYISEFRSLPLSFSPSDVHPQHRIAVRVASPIEDLRLYDFSFFFHYLIFPSRYLNFFGEWELHNREMEVGDVIVQQTRVPPLPISVKLIFGVRILSICKSKKRMSFSYGTLKGHPETGTNEFSFYLQGDSLFAEVHTTAEPGLFLSKFVAPIYTHPFVKFANRQALHIMKESFLKANRELVHKH